jgi:uncharacterized membrane protein
MSETVTQGLGVLVHLLEIAGAGALVLGFIIATILWFQRIKQQGIHPAVNKYRQSLGRTILIGLEILVAATIIKTISVDPSIKSMGFLAIMIVIRTMLGWTTVLEITGRWPWQNQKANSSK